MNEDQAMWYLPGEGERAAGPFTTADISTRCRDGRLQPTTLCWREGMDGWRPLGEMEPFSAICADLPAATAEVPATSQGLDDLGKVFGKAVSLTRNKAKVMSLKVSMSRYEKQRRQLLLEFGEMVYRRAGDMEQLSEAPYAEKLREIRAADASLESLRGEINSIGHAGLDDHQDGNR